MQTLNERKEKKNTNLIVCSKQVAENLDKTMQENSVCLAFRQNNVGEPNPSEICKGVDF